MLCWPSFYNEVGIGKLAMLMTKIDSPLVRQKVLVPAAAISAAAPPHCAGTRPPRRCRALAQRLRFVANRILPRPPASMRRRVHAEASCRDARHPP
ncbi:hypothetical protein, partial [Burkholderia territorii]|uniref:hypothetical protein n=1 Tax=Burkholderia territorii TaxID=1503055 RepID=UPI001ABA10A9